MLARSAGVFAVCTIAVTAQPLEVTAVRFWSLGDITRVAVEVSGEFTFHYDRVESPDRIFFDILGSRAALKKRGLSVVRVGDGLVKQIRVAQTQPEVTRIVLDLAGPAEFESSQLANPDRLIIEVRRAAAPSAAKRASTSGIDAPPKISQPAVLPKVALSTTPPVAPPPFKAATKAGAGSPFPQRTPMAARRDSTGKQSLTRVLGLKVGRIVIDAGHGGHDTGSIGPSGLTEKELVLDVAKRLRDLIETQMGSEVVLTRSEDTFIPLEERTAIANESRADLFLSIHANSSGYKAASGVETYYLNFTSDKSDLEVASRENASSQKTVYELRDVLQKIALADKVDESREFAARVQKAVFPIAARVNSRARNRGVRKAPFVVLIGASMPSILCEIGFISNSRDEAALKRPEHRQRIAEALYKGVSQYASTLSHFEVAKRSE